MIETANARELVIKQINSLSKMAERFGPEIDVAIDLIENCSGRIVLLGMGKSGIVASKIAATLSSTGTTAYFIHPGEAFHGDLGMIKANDVAILISNSGETDELLKLIPYMLSRSIKIILFSGSIESTLAKYSNVVLDVSVEEEACYNNLAPTSSTTCSLVMGDTISIILARRKGFKSEDFAQFHPGGSLGKRLLSTVGDFMKSKDLPFCSPNDPFREVIKIITASSVGAAVVYSDAHVGLITDGDIRRSFDRHDDCRLLKAKDIMTLNPVFVKKDEKISTAEMMMRNYKINHLLVHDNNDSRNVIGIFSLKMMEV